MMLKYQLSKPKFGICVIVASLLSLVGCASPYRAKFTVSDVTEYKIICDQKEEQIKFLHSIKPTRAEMQTARAELIYNPFINDGGYKVSLANGNLDYWIQAKLDEAWRCKK